MASLLLRLFDSDYFSPHLALSYLKTYSDNIGITYYLVYRLKTSFPPEEVEFYWPQLCHLLVTKPSESRALECFILERCEESVHVALLTLWHLQAALFDLSSNPRTPSFKTCKRVYNECQRILYDDPLSDANISLLPSSSARGKTQRVVSSLARAKGKILPWNAKHTVVGMGAVLASVPGLPLLASFSGQVAVEQGRMVRQDGGLDSLGGGIDRLTAEEDLNSDDDEEQPFPGGDATDSEDGSNPTNQDSRSRSASRPTAEAAQHRTGSQRSLSSAADNRELSDTSRAGRAQDAKEALSGTAVEQSLASISATLSGFRGKTKAVMTGSLAPGITNVFATRRSASHQATLTSEVLPPWHPQTSSKQRSIRSSQLNETSSAYVKTAPSSTRLLHTSHSREDQGRTNHSKSVPDLSLGRGSMSLFSSTLTLQDGTAAPVDAVLSQYDHEARRRLLRSNYCRTQTEFLLSLQDISSRLLLLPKPARLSALRAELTALNHRLPAEVCFPLWCSATSEVGAGKDSENAIENSHTIPGTEKEGGSSSTLEMSSREMDQHQLSKRLRHHRVVRINPSEAVVLNSADRAPYLLHVEILQNDLDFDPDRRSNRESLKKLVVAEDLRRRKFALSRAFGADVNAASRETMTRNDLDATAAAVHPGDGNALALASDIAPPSISNARYDGQSSHSDNGGTMETEEVTRSGRNHHTQGRVHSRPSSPHPALGVGEEEEVDLTEQAFGSDLAAFGEEHQMDEDDGEDLAAAMNRNHDAAAWTEAQAKAALGGPGGPAHRHDSHLDRSSIGAITSSAAAKRRDFSLDEYSERMRTAAIMLAQLNKSTNASNHPVVAHNPHVSATAQGGWSSWIIGTSWAATMTGNTAIATKSEVGQGSAGVKMPVGSSSVSGTSQQTSVTAMPVMTPGIAGAGGSSRLIHTDTEAIRKRIMQEMMLLEEERMERMKSGGRKFGGSRRPTAGLEDEATVLKAVNKDDPSAAMFRETWAAKKARIRASSPYGHLPSWDVFSVIVKTGADLRQEQLAVQLINEFGRIWQDCKSPIWVKYFRILVTSESSGLMETVTDAISVHSIKKEAYARKQKESGSDGGKIATYSIFDHFVNTYGDPSSAKFGRARDRFLQSLAGYSIISYLLQIKDRHNGNILLSSDGRIIHIDFGFMLGISPGGVGFEAAPFKLTQEYIDILGGLDSVKFEEFKRLMRQGFKDVRKHAERIIMIVELMQKDSKLPCFALGDFTASNLRDRFALALSATQVDEFVDRLVLASCASSYTKLYDSFQYYSQGIL